MTYKDFGEYVEKNKNTFDYHIAKHTKLPTGENDVDMFGVVKVFNKSLCFGLEWVNSKTEIFTLLFYLGCEQELEVIGNTHTTILSFQEDLV